jgi:hypothetical protein
LAAPPTNGVAEGEAVALAAAEGEAVALAAGEAVALAEGEGEGEEVALAAGEAVALAEGEGEAVALAGVVVLRHCTWHGVVQFAPCTSYVPCMCRTPV